MIGKGLGRYEILAQLGAGGMGEVYRARDRTLGREVALKVLPEAFRQDPERLRRFEHEARAASALNHPNIVTIYDIGQSDGLQYIAMELIEGQDLRSMLGRPLPPKRALALAVQAADGLAKAHAIGIVHRDLKPENLMVSRDGFVKILDFGLAKREVSDAILSADPPTETATRPGALLGTVGYMSPEQARGRPLDFRSDQFAFGSIFYEMATGRPAFRRETPADTLAAILQSEPAAIQDLSPEVPPPLRFIVERCLKKDPDERYASTLDLARELRNVQERLVESTGSGSRPSVLRMRNLGWGRRAGVAAGLAAVGLAVVLLRPAAPLPERKHIAVLPFANAGADPATQAFCNGLVETLTSHLTQLERFQGSLWVVPASETRQAAVLSAASARRAFGVTLAISGSVQRSGGRLRLTANLVDAVSLRQLRSVSLDRSLSDLDAIQDGLAWRVAEMLQLELRPEATRVLEAGGTKVATAFDLYMQGRGHLAQTDGRESLERATGAFQDALQRDPAYALAYAGLGEAHFRLYELTKELIFVDSAFTACERALAHNDLLAPVHVTVGRLHVGTGQAERALADFDRALALDPASGEARLGRAQAKEALSQIAEAEAEYRRAIDLKPDYWGTHNLLGRFLYRQGRLAEAEQAYGRALELVPDNERVLSNLAIVYAVTGRTDDAVATLQRSLRARPTFPAASNLATIEFRRQRYTDAARAFERALALDDRDYRLWRNLAAAYHRAPGEGEKAVAAYRKTAELAAAAIAVNPQDALAHVALADGLCSLGDVKLARDSLDAAVRLAPRNVEVVETAVSVYEELGDREAALRWLKQALELGYALENVERSPGLSGLRTDSRYRALVEASAAGSPAEAPPRP
jgi:tetratricopeptide (TPR) repeat protein